MVELPTKNIFVVERVGKKKPQELTPTELPRKEVFKESSDFALKHNTLKSKVLQVLRQDKYTRKDDFYLCLKIWILSNHIKLIVPLEDFGKIYKPESISRIRREIFKEAKTDPKLKWLFYDTETLDKREKLQELYHDYYSKQIE